MRHAHRTVETLIGTACIALATAAVASPPYRPPAPSDPVIPREVISVLQSHGIAPTPSGLVIGLRNSSWAARIAALQALGRIGRYEQLGYVMALADARAPDAAGKEVRRNAILAAVQIAKRTGGPSTFTRARLLASAQDIMNEAKTPFARLQAADMLGQLGDASQYVIVQDSLKSKELAGRALVAVRVYAKLPAAAYGGQTVDWVPPVSAVLQDKSFNSSDRTNAVIALAEIGSADALSALRNALAGETDPDIKGLIVYTLRCADAKARGAIPPRTPGSANRRLIM